MEFNLIAQGIELVGITIKKMDINNSIVDVEKGAERSLGMEIRDPYYEQRGKALFASMTIDFFVEVKQSDVNKCTIDLSVEGAFISDENTSEDAFHQLVQVNGAAAIIGIARGKIETISACIFNNGKIVIPFVNVIEYYQSLEEQQNKK